MGRSISVEEVFAEWRKDPEYVAAYDALEEEFTLASALIKARARADPGRGRPQDGDDTGRGRPFGKRPR